MREEEHRKVEGEENREKREEEANENKKKRDKKWEIF
jgi:hypothetical protein